MSSTGNRIRMVGILTLAGTPSYVLCFLWHICMAGHMQHGPYPLYHGISDFWWAACFASVLVLSLTLRAKRRMIFLVGSLALIWLRIPLGSLGGAGALIELPCLVTMVVYAILFLVGPGRYERKGEPDAATNSRPSSQLPASPEVQTPDSQRTASSGGCGVGSPLPKSITARPDASAKVSRAWAWLLMSFILVGIVIAGLYALTCTPYTPPVDRRLGMEQQLNVWGFIVLLSAVEIIIGVRLTFILLSRLSYKIAIHA
jgi:hypothetical protein